MAEEGELPEEEIEAALIRTETEDAVETLMADLWEAWAIEAHVKPWPWK